MRVRAIQALAAGLVALLAPSARELLADHAPVPSPPDFVHVGVETDATGTFGPEVVTGYWHVFDVTSHGTSDWVNGHSGNTFKLWRRKDTSGGSTFAEVPVESTQANPNNKRTTFRIRSLVTPAEFEWTNSFYVTEHGGLSQADATAPTATIAVTTPMPAVKLDTRFGASAAAGFFNEAGGSRSVSALPTLVAEATLPTIRMVIFGFNLAYPDYAWSETAPVPANYPGPRIRWNGEFGLVANEHRNVSLGNAVEFDVPVDLFFDHDGTGTAQIEVVQGTVPAASAAYELTLLPPPPGPRNVVAVGDVKKPAKKNAAVLLRWDGPATGPAPSGYVVERRLAADPAKRKDVGVFIELASVAGDILEFQDKKALPDELYEYRVGARLEQLTYAQPDDAWTANKGLKFYGSNADLWPFLFEDAVVGGEPAEVVERFEDTRIRVFVIRAPGIEVGAAMTRKMAQRADVVMKGRVSLRSDDAGLPGWATSLKVGDKATFELHLLRGDPFDPGTYVNVTGTVKIGKTSIPLTMKRKPLAAVTRTVDVAATVGEGSKGKAVKPGDVVAVTFECFNLGQNGPPPPEDDFSNIRGAIVAGTTLLAVSVENGKIDQVLPFPFSSEHFVATEDPAGKDRLVFKVGALGRDGKGKPDMARLALAVKVNASVRPPLKLRTEFILDKDDDGRPDGFKGTQRARILARGERRIVDVAIEKPIAKDED